MNVEFTALIIHNPLDIQTPEPPQEVWPDNIRILPGSGFIGLFTKNHLIFQICKVYHHPKETHHLFNLVARPKSRGYPADSAIDQGAGHWCWTSLRFGSPEATWPLWPGAWLENPWDGGPLTVKKPPLLEPFKRGYTQSTFSLWMVMTQILDLSTENGWESFQIKDSYLPTFTIKINQTSVNLLYMDPMGKREALLQQTLKKEYHYISTFPLEAFLVDWGWQIKLNNGCE